MKLVMESYWNVKKLNFSKDIIRGDKEMYNEEIKISIIIPAWNVEKYIFRALDSCLKQTYENIEIVVIDDGSTDQTVKIVKVYQQKDARVRLLEQPHKGVSAARNLGIDEVNGQKIIFLDSDDWLVKNAIEILIRKTQQYPNFLVGGKSVFISEGREEEGKKEAECKGEDVVLSRHEALMNTSTDKYCNASACYKMFDVDIIRKNNICFDSEILFGEDGLFVFYYLNHVKGMVYKDVFLWNVLVRKTSSTRAEYKEAFITSIYGVEKMLAYPREASESIDIMLKTFLVTKCLNMFRRYLDSGNTKTEILQKYREYIRKYKKEYLINSTYAQKIRTCVILYMPLRLYIVIYKLTHHV